MDTYTAKRCSMLRDLTQALEAHCKRAERQVQHQVLFEWDEYRAGIIQQHG
jgi:hypothetical protein